MAVMTVQPPLRLVPEDARPVGAAAAIVEDEDGGRVFVHGNLAYAWDAGDTAGRRSRRCRLCGSGPPPAGGGRGIRGETGHGAALGCLASRFRGGRVARGTQRAQTQVELTADMVGAIRRLRDGGASYRAVAAEVGVSQGSVRTALVLADADGDAEDPCAPAGSDGFLQPEPEPEPVSGWGSVSGQQSDCSATTSVAVTASVAVQAPVLTDPVDRGAERVLARFGLIGGTAGVHTVRAGPGGGAAAGAARTGGHRAGGGGARRLR